MIQFRDFPGSSTRQVTKFDLVDIARAIGVLTARDENSVDELRALIQTQLPSFAPKSSRQATKADLLGIAQALGLDVKSRPHATGKNMPVEGLRAWIRTFLLERVPVSDVVEEPAPPTESAPPKRAELVFHLPERAYTPIDSLNRRAAAVGSPRYGQLAAHANYNGHRVSVAFNTYRQYWTAEYFWAGRQVLARGKFADCLRAALAEYDRGALGSSVVVIVLDGLWRASDEELDQALAACRAEPRLVEGREPESPDWYTWRHAVAAQCARDSAHPQSGALIFDWDLMQAVESEAAYLDAVRAKHGRTYQ